MLKPKQISAVLLRAQKLRVSAPRSLDDEMTARLLGVEQALLFVLEKESHVTGWLDESERRAMDSIKTH